VRRIVNSLAVRRYAVLACVALGIWTVALALMDAEGGDCAFRGPQPARSRTLPVLTVRWIEDLAESLRSRSLDGSGANASAR
jgi:hypothetical protein